MADEEEKKDEAVDEDIEQKVDDVEEKVDDEDVADKGAEVEEAADEANSEVEEPEEEAPARDRIDDLMDAVSAITSTLDTLSQSVQALVDSTTPSTGDRIATSSEGDVIDTEAFDDLDLTSDSVDEAQDPEERFEEAVDLDNLDLDL